jgi:hypothetical protein
MRHHAKKKLGMMSAIPSIIWDTIENSIMWFDYATLFYQAPPPFMSLSTVVLVVRTTEETHGLDIKVEQSLAGW